MQSGLRADGTGRGSPWTDAQHRETRWAQFIQLMTIWRFQLPVRKSQSKQAY
jgi:hypothetical protein